MSDRDFGRYNCTARNNIGMRFQEFILAQAGECLPQVQLIHVINATVSSCVTKEKVLKVFVNILSFIPV